MTEGNALSELSHFPADWKWFKLTELASIYTGMTPPTNNNDYYGHEYMFVSPADLGGRKYINSTKKHLSQLGWSVARKFPPNSILYTCIGSTIGKCGIAKTTLTSNQQINCVSVHDRVDTEYLYYQLLSASRRIRAAASEQAVPMINKTDFGAQVVCVPDAISEQKAIAKALSDTDALITALEKLIEKKRAIKTATMQQLLTGRTRLPGFGEEWSDYMLGEIGNVYGGLTGKNKSDFGTGKSRYVNFLNVINNRKLNPTKFESVNVSSGERQNKVLAGDIVFNTSSETANEIGMCSTLVSDVGELFLNSFCFGYRLHRSVDVTPLYLVYLIRSEYGRNLFSSIAQGSTRYNLSKSRFNNLKICIPALLEQQAIAKHLDNIDTEIELLDAKSKKIKKIKSAMMQQLLTGRTRLV